MPNDNHAKNSVKGERETVWEFVLPFIQMALVFVGLLVVLGAIGGIISLATGHKHYEEGYDPYIMSPAEQQSHYRDEAIEKGWIEE